VSSVPIGWIRALAIALCLLPLLSSAADDTTNGAAAGLAQTAAPLVVGNRTIVVFRATLLGYGPRARAEGAERRIEQLLKDGGAGAVSSHAIPQGTAIELDGTTVFVVTPRDVDEPAGATMESTVDEAARALELAVKEAHEQREPKRIMIAIGLVALATLLYAAILYGIVSARRRLIALLSGALKSRAAGFKVGGVIALHPAQVFRSVRWLLIAGSWLLALLATDVWLTFSLELFPYTRPWGEHMRGWLLRKLGEMLDAVIQALPGLFTAAIILLVARFLTNVVAGFFRRVQTQRIRIGWLDEDTARPTQRIVVFVVWLFAVAMAYPYLPGAQTEAFKGLSVLAGLMISIGASSLVGQAASGMILMYARALRSGDFVKIGDAEGTVVELGMVATRLKTGTGEEVVLPNAFVVANITRNFSRESSGHGFVVQVQVTIGYSTPWRQVHAMLLDAARRTQGILADPAPYVIQSALSDFYVEYKLCAYAGPEAPSQRALVISELNANVQDVFNEYGVQIMSPHYLADPEHPQIVPKEHWFAAPAQKPDK